MSALEKTDRPVRVELRPLMIGLLAANNRPLRIETVDRSRQKTDRSRGDVFRRGVDSGASGQIPSNLLRLACDNSHYAPTDWRFHEDLVHRRRLRRPAPGYRNV
jgi:hypothetical protein